MTKTKYFGALPDLLIKELIQEKFIKNGEESSIGPDIYDLTVSEEVYRLPFVFMPCPGEKISNFIKQYGRLIEPNSILERGVCYIFKAKESISKCLPDGIYGYSNPKSNQGRIDVLVRTVSDGVSSYDYIPPNYKGSIWIMVVPRSFPIIANEGVSFNQIRFPNRDTRLSEEELKQIFHSDGGILFDKNGNKISYRDTKYSDNDGSVLLSLGFDFDRVGFEALPNNEPIDITKQNFYNPRDFWREIGLSNNHIRLDSNSFYILSTAEYVRVLPSIACEMRPMDERRGQFRVHYAGFITPGWGYGKNGDGLGRPLTLEVRSFDSSLIIRKDQPFAKIRFEMMERNPDKHYDQRVSTFKNQNGPVLAKYFKNW